LLKKIRRWTGIALINLVVLGIMLDALVGTFLLFPAWIRVLPSGVADTIRQVYAAHGRHTIQLDPAQSIVDPELLYRLRPGRFTFSNREFSTPFDVNSLGVRDTEDALRGPEVVVLGDSFAMGWGVRQEEAFPKLLERTTGLRVLNTGVSSYGTARELTLLERVDTSRMKDLVIQYDDNDFPENQAFVDNHNRLKTGDLDAFERLRAGEATRARYVPFKYALGFLDATVRRLRQRRQRARTGQMHADLFLQVLANGRWRLGSARVIVFELSERTTDTSGFAAALRAGIARGGSPILARLEVVDVSGVLTPEMFYDLDGHLRPEGHRAIAALLARTVGFAAPAR
jgi:hypothetical protein